MISRLSGFASNIVAISASGLVQRSDYDTVLVPAVEEALKAHDKVRLYYEIGEDFSGMEAGAMWEDFKVGIEHLTRWERIAVVSDVSWISHTVEAFGFLLPAKVRTFGRKDIDAARAWIVAQ